MSISYKESDPGHRRDNDTEHQKFLAIRSKQGEDLGRISYVEHVSEPQSKNQYSAIQPCLEDALNQGASYALRSTIYRMQPPSLRWYSPTRPLQLRIDLEQRIGGTHLRSRKRLRPQQQLMPNEAESLKTNSIDCLPSAQHISHKGPRALPGFANSPAEGLGVFQAGAGMKGRRSDPSTPLSRYQCPRPRPNVFLDLLNMNGEQKCRWRLSRWLDTGLQRHIDRRRRR